MFTDSAAESASSNSFPIEFESGIPNPGRFPPAPDELIAHIRSYHRGLSRVTVKLQLGRKRYSQINSINVGARYDELPKASVDTIVRAILAVAQDYYEQVDQTCKFMAQVHVHLKGTGDPIRKAVHFELGSEFGQGGSDPYSEHLAPPDSIDDVLLTHIRECHVKIMDQANVIADIGKTAIANAGQVFQYKQEALDAQAAAQQVILDSRRDEARERAQAAKWERGFKMLEKAVNTGIAQALVQQATGAAIPLPAAAGAAPAAAAPAVTPKPSWATAANKGTTGATVKPAPTTTAPETATPEAAAPEPAVTASLEEEFDDTPVGEGRKLYRSVTAEQWPQLFDALTKAQVKQLQTLKDPGSEREMLLAVKTFREGLKDTTMSKLGKILTVEQIAAIIGLAGAAENLDEE